MKNAQYLLYEMIVFLLSAMVLKSSAQNTSTPSHPWYSAKLINKDIWCIRDNDIGNFYLVIGKDSALLIDNGTGAADMKPYLTHLTNLPLIVINSHSHPDHTGSNIQFDHIRAHPSDFEMIRLFVKKENREVNFRTMGLNRVPDSLRFMERKDEYQLSLIPVHDKQIIELGERQIEVIHTPGHTGGSICLLDRKTGYLFTGDNSNGLVWLFPKDATLLTTYLNSLKKLKGYKRKIKVLLPGHGEPAKAEFIGEQIKCVENIISGACTGTPYESFVGKGLLCKYKSAQVAYDPEKIR